MNSFKIVRNNFKRSFNRRTGFMVNLIIPIIVVMLGIFANSVSKPSFLIGIIHNENAANIVKTLEATEGITIANANPATTKIDLITGKYSVIVDFSKSDYELLSIKDHRFNDDIRSMIDICKTSSFVDIEKVVGTGMSIAERTIAFMVLFLMVTATVTASLMIKDKNNGTFKRYQFSPQKRISYVLGNYIYNYLITFFQYVISVSFMQLLRVDMGISYPNFIFMGLWISGIATAFGTLMSSIFQKEMYANLFAALIALILSLIGGTFIAYEHMPALLQHMSVISPLHWFLEITKSMELGVSWFRNTQQITIISAMVAGMIIVSSLIHKKTKMA